MIRAIFFDIDGTLVSFKTHAVPESTKEALRSLHRQGVRLFIATGRAKGGLGVLKGLPFDGFITLNGQYCFDTADGVLYENTILREDLEILLEEIEKDPFPAGFVRREDKVFNFRDERVDAIHAITHNDNHPAGDVSHVLDEEIYQVMCFVDEEREKQMLGRMKNCTAARWHPSFCDISPLGGTKVRGIEVFLEHYGLDLSQAMAFGDGGNDFEMLEYVPNSVAMGNAPDNVKEVSSYVTEDVDHDGIVNALKHFRLIV